MFKISKITILFSMLACLFLASCKKKDFENYYARPSNLADPIYQQLVAKGNFTSLLKCIDKAGYKETLSAGGFWTLFAADDAAFTPAAMAAFQSLTHDFGIAGAIEGKIRTTAGGVDDAGVGIVGVASWMVAEEFGDPA